MIGTLVNAITVLAGGALGLILRREIPEKFRNTIFEAVGLATLAIGAAMIIKTANPVILILGLLLGTFIGESLKIDEHLNIFAERVKGKLKEKESKFSEGMITAFITFCVGPMTIIGSIEDGLGDPSIILAKSMLDGVVAVMYAASMGIGVLFSAILLLLYQGSIALSASFLKNGLTEAMLNNLTGTGGALLLGLGISLLEIKKIKVVNMLPSIVVVPLLTVLAQ